MSAKELEIPALPAVKKWYKKLDGSQVKIIDTRLSLLRNEDIIDKLQETGAVPSTELERLPLNPLNRKTNHFSDAPQIYLIRLPQTATKAGQVILFAIHDGEPLLLTVAERSRQTIGKAGYDVDNAIRTYRDFLADQTTAASGNTSREGETTEGMRPGSGRSALLEAGAQPLGRKGTGLPDL